MRLCIITSVYEYCISLFICLYSEIPHTYIKHLHLNLSHHVSLCLLSPVVPSAVSAFDSVSAIKDCLTIFYTDTIKWELERGLDTKGVNCPQYPPGSPLHK